MPYKFKQRLEKIAGEKAPGPSPSFSVFHLLRAIELVAKKTMGRAKLAVGLNVGEGAVRTMLERLKDDGLVAISRDGCTLTSEA